MKTHNNIDESLWELWNSPVDDSENKEYGEEKLTSIHRAIGEEKTHNKKTAYYAIGAVAALAAVCIALSIRISIFSEYRDNLASELVTVSAGLDGPTELILPDGTTVVLTARSTITYNMDFGATDRSVCLDGQGYFDVTKNPEKHFVVTTQNMTITVHGTKFNVYAYPERKIDEVSLVEGIVSVASGGNVFKMHAGEKVLYDKATGSIHISRTDNAMETAWLGKELTFNHTPLYVVFETLERRFGVTIKPVPGMDLNDRYTGSFTDRNLGDIINVLKMHYGFDYQMSDNTVELK